MQPKQITITAPGTYYWNPDWRITPFSAALEVVFGAGATATYEIDYTLTDINSVPNIGFNGGTLPVVNWSPLPAFPVGGTVPNSGIITSPVQWVRIVVSAVTGTIYFNGLQGESIN